MFHFESYDIFMYHDIYLTRIRQKMVKLNQFIWYLFGTVHFVLVGLQHTRNKCKILDWKEVQLNRFLADLLIQ